jgi:hypothetical protein
VVVIVEAPSPGNTAVAAVYQEQELVVGTVAADIDAVGIDAPAVVVVVVVVVDAVAGDHCDGHYDCNSFCTQVGRFFHSLTQTKRGVSPLDDSDIFDGCMTTIQQAICSL